MLKTIIKKTLLLASGSILLVGCSQSEETSQGLYEDGVLTVGVTSGPHEEVMNFVKDQAAEDDFNIEVVVFNDYVQPNVALDDESLDANSFMTGPFLEDVINEQNYDFIPLARTITLPMAIHSYDYDSIEEIPDNATIGIPNSPTQEGRALQLIAAQGLITLPENSGLEVVVDDIVDNPKNLEFVTSDPAQLPIQLEDLDAAAINSNFAIDSGLGVTEYSIAVESEDELLRQANLIVAREENEEDEAIATLIDYYQTDEVKDFIEDSYEGAIVPAWELSEE